MFCKGLILINYYNLIFDYSCKQICHGYMIIQELEHKNIFEEEKADNTGVYRTLANLENRGMIRFEWIMDISGPAKKNYMITVKGLECLENWISTLQIYNKKVNKIIEDARDVLAKQ